MSPKGIAAVIILALILLKDPQLVSQVVTGLLKLLNSPSGG